MTRARSSGLILVATLGFGACRSDHEVAPTELPAPPPSSHTPPDTVEPGELREGNAAAFGLALPAGMQIETSAPRFIQARGRAGFDRVIQFVRDRVDAKNIVVGPSKTTFDDVTVKQPRGGVPSDGVTRLRVDVADSRRGTVITCQRYTLPEVPEGLSKDELWKRSGLTKDGKPIDPGKFE